MQKRYFTVDEVNALVPRLYGLFSQVMQCRTQLKALYKRLEAKGFAPPDEPFTPDAPGAPPDVVRDRAAFKALLELLRSQLAEIGQTGCIVKDVETGLVDWFARSAEGEVFLCWRFGEKEVAFFHDLESGFAGRRPVSELVDAPAEEKPRTLH